MSSPEVVRLDRRVTAQDESLRAIADTTVEIKDAVDGHTTTLAEHSQQLGDIRQEQERQATKLAEIEQQVTEGFAAILRRLDAR
jgi:hypothetical protein